MVRRAHHERITEWAEALLCPYGVTLTLPSPIEGEGIGMLTLTLTSPVKGEGIGMLTLILR